MDMKIKGLIVDKDNKVKYFIVKYYYNQAVHSVTALKRQLEVFKADGVEVRNGVVTITQKFPKYRIENLEKVESLMNVLESREIKKELAGIDEEPVGLCISENDNRISVRKSFRDSDFFTEYDYDSNGYNDAQFDGWDTIPNIVEPFLKGQVTKDKISCDGGEKLWFSVEIDCDFANLVPLSS